MASSRPQRIRRPPVYYGHDPEEDTYAEFRPPSPPRKPLDSRPPFDPDLVDKCAFPSLDPATHIGPGPSEVYNVGRQFREQRETKKMIEYETWYRERSKKMNLRKRVVGKRDISPFPCDCCHRPSRRERDRNRERAMARSLGLSVEVCPHVGNEEKRARWEKSREMEFEWDVGSSCSEGDEEQEEEEEEVVVEEKEENVQQRDMEVKTFRLLLVARNVNHRNQIEAVAAVERARNRTAQSSAAPNHQGRTVSPALPLTLAALATAAALAGENQRDSDGDTVMGGGGGGGGSLPLSTRQLVEALPKARWTSTIERRPKTPRRRPTAAEKGKGKEVLPREEEVSRHQSTMDPRLMSEEFDGYFHGIDPFEDVNPWGVETSTVQILNTSCVATADWTSVPANIQYLITYLLTVIHEPPYSFEQMCRLLSLSSDDIISLLYLINQETRKMIILNNLNRQLAAVTTIHAIRDALDRIKPEGLFTDSISPENIRQGQAFLRYMGLHEVAEWLTEYMGVSNTWYDDATLYFIMINGRLLSGDILAEVAGEVLESIWKEEKERMTSIEQETRRAEAASASMRPPPPGVVNPSALELPLAHRSAGNDKVLTIQETEQVTRRLADLGLLVPVSGHYTVSLNGQSVHLEEGLQARRIWNQELDAMRQALRQRQQQKERQAMAPPARPPPRGRGNQEATPAEVPKSPNSRTKEHLLSIGINLSLHKPPSVNTGSPTLEARTAALLALPANKDLLAAMDEEDAEKDHLIDDERASRDVSEARTLRSNSVYSSRYPSEAPPGVPAATTRTTRGNRQASTAVPANFPPQSSRAVPAAASTARAARGNRQASAAPANSQHPGAAPAATSTAPVRTARGNRKASIAPADPQHPGAAPAATSTARTARGNQHARKVPVNPRLQSSRAAREVSRSRQEEASTSREGTPGQPVGERAQNARARNNPRQQVKNPTTTTPATQTAQEHRPRQVQVATEARAGASSGTPHHALAESGSSRPVPKAATTTVQREQEARPAVVTVAVATPSPAPETPVSSSQKKTRIVLKVGGRRVVSQSHITSTDNTTNSPQTEPPVVHPTGTSPPILGRNFTEPTTRRHRDASQDRDFGVDATRDAPSPGSFNQSALPTRRNLFGTSREPQQSPYPTSGTPSASNHNQEGRVPTPPLGIFRPPPRNTRRQDQVQVPPPAVWPNRALTESGSRRLTNLIPSRPSPSVTPATIPPTQTISPQVPFQAVTGKESQQTMRGRATEDVGNRRATRSRSRVHGEEHRGSGS